MENKLHISRPISPMILIMIKHFSFVNLNVGLYHFNVQESGTKKGRANIQDFAFHIFERMHTFFVEFAELQKSTEINYNTNSYGRRKKLNTKTFF